MLLHTINWENVGFWGELDNNEAKEAKQLVDRNIYAISRVACVPRF